MALWGRILTDGRELAPSRVEIADGRILSIEPAASPSSGDLAVEPGTGWIAPGLIDLQVNGAGGVDLTSAEHPRDALEHVARTLAAHGVTAFCPTIVSSPLGTITRALRNYAPQKPEGGAESLGVHVEGPFIDPAHRGVHDPANLRLATVKEVEQWLEHGAPAIVTLAPELAGAAEAIHRLNQKGVTVSLGHSGATAEQAQAALQAGASMATHLFNAMPPLLHREPGLVGALLASNAVLGLIADGVHLHPLVAGLVIRRAGAARVALVSDALASAGAPPGESVLGDQTVVSDGRTVKRRDGTLAGSAVLLADCLKNVRVWLPDLPPATLIEMATRTPADLLGATRKGRLAVGCDADLVILAPDFTVCQTILRGQLVA